MDVGPQTVAGEVLTGSAVLDQDGNYLRLDHVACEWLGVSAAESVGRAGFARVPDGPDEVWWLEERPEVARVPLICRMVQAETGEGWLLEMSPAADSMASRATVRSYAERVMDTVATADRASIVRAMAEALSEICGLTGGLVVLIDEGSGVPTFAGGSHMGREELGAMEECRRRGAPMVIWQAFAEKRIVVKREWERHVRRDPRLEPIRRLVITQMPSHAAHVAVPFGLGSRRIGVLSAMVVDPGEITPGLIRLLWDIAHPTAVALHCAEAIRTARASDRDRERRRLNEDLHNSVAQDVFALRMLAARTEVDALQTNAPELAGRLAEIRAFADQVSTGLQALIGDRRQVGQTIGLSRQLTGLAREMGSRAGVDVQAVVGDEWDRLSPDCRDSVIRIVQEALRNIEKHAHARTAVLRVVEDAAASGMLLIEVADDGESFDPDSVGPTGFGLTSIRERAAEHGGTVEIRTTPRTALRVRLRPSFETEWDAAVRG